MYKKRLVWLICLATALVFVGPAIVQAVPLTSTHFRLDPDAFNAAGGLGTSTNYKLLDSVGEPIIGNGSGGSYKLSAGYISQLQQSIELNVQPTGLAAYYPFDTNTGRVAYDATSNNNHASFVGSPTWQTGKIGSSFSTNSSSDYATVPSASALNQGGSFTVSTWIRPGTATQASNAVVLSKGATPTNYKFVYTSGGQTVSFVVDGSSTTTVTSTTLANDTSLWYNVVGVVSGTSVKLYINGAQEAAGTLSGTPQTNTDPLLFNSSPTYNGSIDETKIFSRALSVDEVRNEYNAVSAGVRSAQTIPQVTPGISQTTSTDATVLTDAGGYDLAISQNNNLTHTDTTTTIPAITGSTIASPNLWDEGNTKGLGFTLTSGISLPGKWGTGPNYAYAAIPGSGTTFFSRTGLSGGAKEVTTMQYRLDVNPSQKAGAYTNTVTITATVKP